VALLLVTVLPLCGLEAILRMAGYGYSTSLFRPLRIGGEEFLVENDSFSFRFFPPELARTPGPIRMKPAKPAGTCRIFILGESAAMGDPEPGYGAARYLEVLLRERFPGTRFELVNVAFTAINSHVILPIARECAAREGDLWIIYMGNNEMVGPFGPATVFGAKAPPVELVRLGLALQETRVGQALAALGRRLKAKSSGAASWGGMQMFLGNQVPPNSPRREAAYRSFRKNLDDILRTGRKSGAGIILSTVAVNLKDCPPFASMSSASLPDGDRARLEGLLRDGEALEGQGRFGEAARCYEQAAGLDSFSAEAQFRWGRCLLRLTNAPAARSHFQAACDLDALSFRTDSRLNQIITNAARHWELRLPGGGAEVGGVLFDAAGWVGQAGAEGIPGEESFYEHVHFNFDGNYRLALGWAEQAARLLPAAATRSATADWASQELCERRLGLTDWNRTIVAEGMVRRMKQAPLSAQSNNDRRMAALQARVNDLRRGMDAAGAAQAREIYLDAIRRAPDDYGLHENFASFLVATGDAPGATAQWQQARELIPQDYLANYRVGELLAMQGKLAEAEAPLLAAAALRPFISDPWFELARVHTAQGRLEQSLAEFARARQLRPSDPDYAYQWGRTLALLNRRAEAIGQFREAVRLNPDSWPAHDALGGQLGLQGDIAAAKDEFKEVIRLKPDYGRAHLNLGVALLKENQAGVAAVEFQEALRLEPTNTVAADYLRQARAAASRKP
jgi:tetratricopeptide (TPR) repeat protein